jgi:hypothetical protein
MNTSTSISMSNRIAAGVTAEYVRDLARRPVSVAAPAPAARRDGRRPALRGRRVATAALGRDRDDCGGRRHALTV